MVAHIDSLVVIPVFGIYHRPPNVYKGHQSYANITASIAAGMAFSRNRCRQGCRDAFVRQLVKFFKKEKAANGLLIGLNRYVATVSLCYK